ncbi:type IV secretory system conjugative DNA transfer family protein [Microbacterium sp. MRS-1]|uniref:type IV secretory system conjugative DNA transfer family protein n=1 Tax=Microbacterium sp. MRS-1 TaxID=1451261 RepID=UPI00044F8E35|nr:FtsK/SpoIIIE domain-containing protein [Microbacterium sp. MRS-1]EXJ50751.1 hypothetical protein AS96_12995 [Microbacterium sp. MRS-1]
MATTTTKEDQRVLKLPKVPAVRKAWLHTAAAHREAFGKASTKRGKGWAKLLTTVPAVWLGLGVWVALVLIWSCVFGWVDDLPRFFKDEDDTDLRRKLALFRWLSLVNTALLIALLAFAFPAAFPLGVLVLGAAVTNRVTAQVWKSKKNPFAPKTGFVKKAGDRYAASVIERDGQIVGSWWWRAASASLLVPIVAFAVEGMKAPELAAYGLIVPDGIRNIAVAAVAVFALLLAVLGGVSTGRRLRAEFGHEVAFKDALREKLILALGQESASGQKQFMTAEEQGLLRIERSTTEVGGWEITLPTSLWPVLRDEEALKASLRRELDTDNLQFMLSDVWEGHFAIGPLDDEERRIRRNLRESGGLTMDDPGFDDPNGMEEPLPRGFTVDDLEDWDKTAAIAATFAELGLQLVGFNRASKKCIVEAEATATPRARWKELTSASERAIRQDAEMLARRDRAVVLDLDLVERRVLLSPMLPAIVAERETIATELKADLMKVRIAVTWSTEGRAESIDVETRAVSPDPDAARETWRKVINAIHGGSNGWLIHPDPVRGMTKLVYGEPRALPALVPVVDLLPSATGIDAWNHIPLGRDSRGGLVTWDMEAGVHALIVGPTGSGKSIQLLDIILNVLARGGDVVVIDGSPKRGADFMKVRGFTRAWADNPLDASEVLEAVYAEGRRRADLVLEYGGASWHDIPADVRARERVVPLVAVVDEYAALTALRDIPKGADKEDPKVVAAQEVNAAKSNVMMVMDDITREMRFVGIRVVLGLQRGDASILSGFMRNNFPTKIQLKTPNMPLDPAGLRMMFPGEYGIAAEEEFRALDTGEPGLGVTAQEGGAVTGYRGGFIKAEGDAIPELIASLGISVPPPLVAQSAPAPQQSPAPAPQPVPSSSKDDDWLL